MNRKKILIAYEMAAIVPLIIITIFSMVTGIPVVTSITGVICSIALMLASITAVHVAIKRKVADTLDDYVNMYNMECDPEKFLVSGGQMAFNMMQERQKGDKLSEADAWYLSLYGLAYVDTNKAEEAEKLACAILEDLEENKTDKGKASMLVSVEPLLFRLHGTQEALAAMDRALGLLEGDTSRDADGLRSYVTFESKVLRAIEAGDTETVKDTFTAVYHNTAQPMRLRVMGADAVASICRVEGDEGGELTALTFVEEHGNKLPMVPAAVERAAELF